MAAKNGKRSLEEILEEHLEVTKGLRAEMQQGFKRVEGRIDNLIATMGGARKNHEQRITALEADVAKLKAG